MIDENLKQKLIQENKFIDIQIFNNHSYRYFITNDDILIKMLKAPDNHMREAAINYCKKYNKKILNLYNL